MGADAVPITERKKCPEVGTKMYLLHEHLYHIPDRAAPVKKYCVCEAEVQGNFTGGYTEIRASAMDALPEEQGVKFVRIGLVDVDSRNFPNLALMKLSAWHKAQGDSVEWWWGFGQYDQVYMSKVFDETYSPDLSEPLNAKEIIKGGTGYGLDNCLPNAVEHIYPDYSIYPELTKETAYGFLTRGCPRSCLFCIVAKKEGQASVKVADLSEWWSGQKYIKLLDPNLLACQEHMDLLGQLADSGAWVDFTQGLDIRLTNARNVELIQRVRTQTIHFAWDDPAQDMTEYFRRFKDLSGIRDYRKLGVYVLTNYGDGETVDEKVENALRRINPLRDLGYNPYVMIYDKPNAPKEIRMLQRWCNNRIIFRTEPDFYRYDPKRG